MVCHYNQKLYKEMAQSIKKTNSSQEVKPASVRIQLIHDIHS